MLICSLCLTCYDMAGPSLGVKIYNYYNSRHYPSFCLFQIRRFRDVETTCFNKKYTIVTNLWIALTCWDRSLDVMCFLWGTDKPIELSSVLNKRKDRKSRIPVQEATRSNTVSDDTVMYGYWSSETWPVSDCTVSYRPIFSSERAPNGKNNKAIVTKERIRIKSGHVPQRGSRYQDELVDWSSAVR
jgi:hypothetical protein